MYPKSARGSWNFSATATVEQQGKTVLSGSYTAEEMADGTLCLTVGQGGEESLWTCGIRTEADGKETLCITAQVGDFTVSFVPVE